MASSSRKRRKKRRAKQRRAAAPPAADSADAPSSMEADKAPARKSRRADPDGAPPAPWGSFPLVELVVLVGIVMMIGGIFAEGRTRVVMVLTGLALGSLAGLELSVREHFAGYRSHTALLGSVPGLITIAVLFAVAPDMSPLIRVAAGAVVAGASAYGLMTIFRNRSGGHAFRVARPRR